jgi:hypothetical protein
MSAAMEIEERERREQEAAQRERLALESARHVIALWNIALAAHWPDLFYPTVGTTLTTGCYWLHVICPVCQILGEALRKIDIHPKATMATIVRKMSYDRCSPHPRFARALGVTRRPWFGDGPSPQPWLS